MRVASPVVFGLTVMLTATSHVPAAPRMKAKHRQPVIHFLSSGDRVTIRLRHAASDNSGTDHSEPLLLSVFGRSLAKLSAQAGVVSFRAPVVRTVTRLTLSTSGDQTVVLAEILVYPKAFRLTWNGKSSIRVATRSPQWVGQWLHAVGLPYEESVSRQGPPRTADSSPGVLVVAGTAAGRTCREFDKQYRDRERNTLILSAGWFGPATGRKKGIERIVPTNLFGPLEKRQNIRWSRAVRFDIRQPPWTGLVNRHTWIMGQSAPVVEELFTDWKRGSVIASYVPWQSQLGCNEIADQLFLDLLQAVSRHRSAKVAWRPIQLQYPEAGLTDDVNRPVLIAAANRQPKTTEEPMVEVFDLRGPDGQRFSADRILRDLRQRAGQSPVLVLGSDDLRHVDNGIRRAQKRSKKLRGNLIRLASDQQHPSPQDQIRLMEVLTNLRVQLGTLSSQGVLK